MDFSETAKQVGGGALFLIGSAASILYLYDYLSTHALSIQVSYSFGGFVLAVTFLIVAPFITGYWFRGRRKIKAWLVYRKDLQGIPQILKSAKTEVYVLAFTAETFRQIVGDLINFLKAGKRITFVFLKSEDRGLTKRFEEAMDCPNTLEASSATIATLKSARENKELSLVQSKNLRILTHDQIPFWSMVAIDPESDNGKVYVEFYTYRHDPTSRTNLVISKKQNKNLFSLYWTGFKFVLDHSTEA